MVPSSPWFVKRAVTAPRMRLFCFPYSGGQAGMYAPWQAALGDRVEVCAIQLPGRGGRIRERPLTSIEPVVDLVAPLIAACDEIPFALFGHSMGALLAFETARRLVRDHRRGPSHLFVSGCDAPSVRRPGHLHLLPDDELVEELRRYNGTPEAVLSSRELLALFLPILRADFSIGGTYAYQASPKLDLPMTVLAGRRDPYTPVERVEPWRKETMGESQVRWFDGDHFFIHGCQDEVIACVEATLDEHCTC